jgi:hypothetical protein
MPRCVVTGCTRPLWWRGRRLARQVTDLDAHLPALEQLRATARRRADDCNERELRWTIGIGRGYRWHMHEAAHGDRFARTSLPTQAQLDDWCVEARQTATRWDGAPQR